MARHKLVSYFGGNIRKTSRVLDAVSLHGSIVRLRAYNNMAKDTANSSVWDTEDGGRYILGMKLPET